MSQIKDNKSWVYIDEGNPIIGLMRCAECGRKVKAPFRYYFAKEAFVHQCFQCGHERPSWAERLEAQREAQRVQDLEDRRTDILTLLDRIKDAFEEGCSNWRDVECFGEDEAWEQSEAKRIYDILRKQAMEQ